MAKAAFHVANALGENSGADSGKSLTAISRAFLNEVKETTGFSEGDFLDRDA